MSPRAPSLSRLLAEIPDEHFWVPDATPAKPAYNQIFAEVLRHCLELPDHEATLKVREVYEGRIPNLSSFQRAVAKEASDRRRRAAEIDPSLPLPPAAPDPDALTARLAGVLPPELVEAVAPHLPEAAPPPASQQHAAIDAYLQTLPEALSRNEFLDVPLAEDIGRAARELLAATAQSSAEDRALVAAAIAYFVDPDDAEHDLESLLGFDDDAQVLAAVIRLLGVAVTPPGGAP